jgi:hypothetical protein
MFIKFVKIIKHLTLENFGNESITRYNLLATHRRPGPSF